jgi:hypothetical protein
LSRRTRARLHARRFRTCALAARDAFRRIDLGPCGPSRQVHAPTVRRCLPTSHPFACRDVARLRPGSSCRLTLPRPRPACLSARPPRNEEDASHRHLQLQHSRHEHLLERSDSRGDMSRFHVPRHVHWSQSSTGRLEWLRALTVRCQLRRIHPRSARHLTGVRAPAAPGGPPDRGGPQTAPLRGGFVGRGARRMNEPLTLPVAAPRGRDLASPPGPLPPPLRQRGTASPARSAFHRRVACP